MEYLFLIWILASFVGAGKRVADRELNFVSFLKFIAEFLFYPVVRAIEEFELDF